MRYAFFGFFIVFCLWACQRPEQHPAPVATPVKTVSRIDTTKDFQVALQPFGTIDTAALRIAKTALENFYRCSVTIRPAIDLPMNAWYAPRNRYKADSLIAFLAEKLPGGYDHIVGLTTKDISTRNDPYEDWGIMGLGYCPGKSCVISTFRLKRDKEPQKFSERFAKVVLHECGHTLGLQHCNSGDTTCFMEDGAGTIKTVDREQRHVCASCVKKIPGKLR